MHSIFLLGAEPIANYQHRIQEGEEKLMQLSFQIYLLLLKHEKHMSL